MKKYFIIGIGTLVLLAILMLSVVGYAEPEQQITINPNPPTVKGIYPGGIVGNCDIYLVDIDEPGRSDSTATVLVCGDDRVAH